MRRAPDVIRVKMGQNYFSDAATFLHQAINKCIEFSLFLFVWRGWVDVDQCLLPVGHPPQKERSIESARREMGRHPSASRFEIRASNLQAIFLKNLLEGRLTTLCRFSLRTDSLERQSFSASREQHAGL